MIVGVALYIFIVSGFLWLCIEIFESLVNGYHPKLEALSKILSAICAFDIVFLMFLLVIYMTIFLVNQIS